MRKIYEKYLLYIQPLAAQTKAKEDKGKEKEKERETDTATSSQDRPYLLAIEALKMREAMRTPQKEIQSQRQSTPIELKSLKYIFDENHNLITSDRFTPTAKYLTAQDVAALSLDPEKPPQVATWLKDRLGLTGDIKVQSVQKFGAVGQMSSENYRLSLFDKSSNLAINYFIKVEASPLRFGVQARADHLVKSLGFPKDEGDPIFVTQLTSVMVEFGGDNKLQNEVMVFPEIKATAPNQNNPLHWEAIGKALARLKIASMQHYDTYDSFKQTGQLSKVFYLPDLHHHNVMVDQNNQVYFIDYQNIKDPMAPNTKDTFSCFDVSRLRLSIKNSNALTTYETGFLSEFPEQLWGSLRSQCFKDKEN
jgi:hypothetical protein